MSSFVVRFVLIVFVFGLADSVAYAGEPVAFADPTAETALRIASGLPMADVAIPAASIPVDPVPPRMRTSDKVWLAFSYGASIGDIVTTAMNSDQYELNPIVRGKGGHPNMAVVIPYRLAAPVISTLMYTFGKSEHTRTWARRLSIVNTCTGGFAVAWNLAQSSKD